MKPGPKKRFTDEEALFRRREAGKRYADKMRRENNTYVKARQRKWYAKTKEARRAYALMWYYKNRQRILAARPKYTPEEGLRVKQWRHKNMGRVRRYRKGLREKLTPGYARSLLKIPAGVHVPKELLELQMLHTKIRRLITRRT